MARNALGKHHRKGIDQGILYGTVSEGLFVGGYYANRAIRFR